MDEQPQEAPHAPLAPQENAPPLNTATTADAGSAAGGASGADDAEVPKGKSPAWRDGDIYEHPYVKRLEGQIDKLETKYEAQVRRTEEVQLIASKQLVELQRMT